MLSNGVSPLLHTIHLTIGALPQVTLRAGLELNGNWLERHMRFLYFILGRWQLFQLGISVLLSAVVKDVIERNQPLPGDEDDVFGILRGEGQTKLHHVSVVLLQLVEVN